MNLAEELNATLETIQYKNYFVREDGVVFNDRGQEVRPFIVINRNGRRYWKIHLYTGDGLNARGREIWFLHRLMAWNFYGPFDPWEWKLIQVDHISNDSLDCSLWNIECMDQSGNLRRRYQEFSSTPF